MSVAIVFALVLVVMVFALGLTHPASEPQRAPEGGRVEDQRRSVRKFTAELLIATYRRYRRFIGDGALCGEPMALVRPLG